jgi:hypothetical protein
MEIDSAPLRLVLKPDVALELSVPAHVAILSDVAVRAAAGADARR